MRLEGDGQVQVQARGIAGSPVAMSRADTESGRRKGRPGAQSGATRPRVAGGRGRGRRRTGSGRYRSSLSMIDRSVAAEALSCSVSVSLILMGTWYSMPLAPTTAGMDNTMSCRPYSPSM